MKEELICGDCHSILEFEKKQRGSAFVEMFLWLTLFFLGFFYSLWRRSKPKKFCEYCGSNFLIPNNKENFKLLSQASKRSVVNVPSDQSIQAKFTNIDINSKKEFNKQAVEESLNLQQNIKISSNQSENSFSKNTDFQEF